jgi:hypothetical protein
VIYLVPKSEETKEEAKPEEKKKSPSPEKVKGTAPEFVEVYQDTVRAIL